MKTRTGLLTWLLAIIIVVSGIGGCRALAFEKQPFSTTSEAFGGLKHELVKLDVEKYADYYKQSAGEGGFFLVVGGGSFSSREGVDRKIEIVFAVKLNIDDSIMYVSRPVEDVRFRVSDNYSVEFQVGSKDWHRDKTLHHTYEESIRVRKNLTSGGAWDNSGVKQFIINAPKEVIDKVIADIFYQQYEVYK